MGKNYLVVVDMQKDFVDGSLGTAEAAAMLDGLTEYVRNYDGEIIFTLDTHTEEYMDTQEGNNLPVPHCIKGTDGWKLAGDLEKIAEEKGCLKIEKPTFPSRILAEELLKRNEEEAIESITFIGVCTDICVVSNALTVKAFLPEVPLKVVEKYTEGTSTEMKLKTLDVMRCCQIEVL